MKSKLVIKFVLALTIGSVFGLVIHSDQEKWHQLGREAFLSYQSSQFDHNHATAAGIMIVCAVFALGLYSLYEGVAFAILKLVTHFQSAKLPCRPELSS